MTQLERVEPGFFEADEEGYMQASEEVGEDGCAIGIEFVLYVQDPRIQLEHSAYMWKENEECFKFTDEENEAWPQWVQQRYPLTDWNFDIDDGGTASFYSDFRPGEDNNALMMRLCVYNNAYSTIRDQCCILYVMMHCYIDHCQRLRENAATSGIGWPE